MSNDESPEKPQQLSNDNTKFADTDYSKDKTVATTDRVTVVVGPHTAPRATPARPFSGSPNEMTNLNITRSPATPNTSMHPTNDALSSHHVSHHIRTNSSESPSCPMHGRNTAEEEPSTPRSRLTQHLPPTITIKNMTNSSQGANQTLMDPKKSATTVHLKRHLTSCPSVKTTSNPSRTTALATTIETLPGLRIQVGLIRC